MEHQLNQIDQTEFQKDKCELCGKMSYLLPVGPEGKQICYTCSTKHKLTVLIAFIRQINKNEEITDEIQVGPVRVLDLNDITEILIEIFNGLTEDELNAMWNLAMTLMKS